MTYATDMLKAEHEVIKTLLNRIEQTSHMEISLRNTLTKEADKLIHIHENMEEIILYPYLMQHCETSPMIFNLIKYEKQDLAAFTALCKIPCDTREWEEKFKNLKAAHLNHFKEEEKNLFPLVKQVLSTEILTLVAQDMIAYKQSKMPTPVKTRSLKQV